MAERPEQADAIDLSIVVVMGYEGQTNLGTPTFGDEFNHLASVAETKHNVELVIVDRAWPSRGKRAIRMFRPMAWKIRYIPPRPTLLTRRGYFNVASAMNSGGVCSRGQLLMFIGDFLKMNAAILDEVCDAYYNGDKLLHPFIQSKSFTLEEKEQVFSGHNSGIKVCTRDQFRLTQGWEEYFDGTYGEEDVEWQQRLDVLNNVQPGLERIRRMGVDFHRSRHENGINPTPFRPLWTQPAQHGRTGLRCNRVFYHSVIAPRLGRNEYRGNVPLSAEEYKTLLEAECTPDCPICHREDRIKQVASYGLQDPPAVPLLMRGMEDMLEQRHGIFDPWRGHQLTTDGDFEEDFCVEHK